MLGFQNPEAAHAKVLATWQRMTNGIREQLYSEVIADYGMSMEFDKDEISRRCVLQVHPNMDQSPDILLIDGNPVLQVWIEFNNTLHTMALRSARLDK